MQCLVSSDASANTHWQRKQNIDATSSTLSALKPENEEMNMTSADIIFLISTSTSNVQYAKFIHFGTIEKCIRSREKERGVEGTGASERDRV